MQHGRIVSALLATLAVVSTVSLSAEAKGDIWAAARNVLQRSYPLPPEIRGPMAPCCWARSWTTFRAMVTVQ